MRRGFVMPIVILLAMVVGVVAAVMLQRLSTLGLSVQHELHGYRDHHFSRGVREVVGAWTTTLSGQPIQNMIEEDGHILDIQAADGVYVAVYMFDGQGSVVTDPATLTEEERIDTLGVLEQLALLSGDNPDPSWLRPAGPAKICAASAAPEVLEALVNYASGGGREGRRFADEVVKARDAQPLTQAAINTALATTDLTGEQRQIVTRMLVVTPELWNMVLDVYPPGAQEPSVRYGARFLAPGSAAATRNGSTLQSLGNFLTWEELPVREEAPPVEAVEGQ